MTRKQAQVRNFKIIRLRATYSTLNNLLLAQDIEQVKEAIDRALTDLFAETQVHEFEELKKWRFDPQNSDLNVSITMDVGFIEALGPNGKMFQ